MSTNVADRSRGQGLVEFALILPIVVVLLLALFDAGRAVLFYSELTNASRVGARAAIVNQSNSAACPPGSSAFKCVAADQVTGMDITPSDISDLTITGSECALLGACSVTVALDYSFEPITPVVGWMLGSVNLSASTTMPIERLHAAP